MNLFGHPFPDVLLKVSSNREHLEELRRGILYMNESGFFRKLEDRYRGDPYDGMAPVSLKQFEGQSLKLGEEDALVIPTAAIRDFRISFSGDEKIPIYCCTAMDEKILQPSCECPDAYAYHFREEFISEMEQFGSFVAIFYSQELIQEVSRYATDNELYAEYGMVEYVDIMQEYSLDLLNERRDKYAPFFKKDRAYQWQNEWRLILYSDRQKLIGEKENHIRIQPQPPKWFHILSLTDLRKREVKIFKTELDKTNEGKI